MITVQQISADTLLTWEKKYVRAERLFRVHGYQPINHRGSQTSLTFGFPARHSCIPSGAAGAAEASGGANVEGNGAGNPNGEAAGSNKARPSAGGSAKPGPAQEKGGGSAKAASAESAGAWCVCNRDRK